MTIINDGLPMGGTCVNVGCVPSKTLLRAAEDHHQSGSSRFAGINPSEPDLDFQTVINEKRQLVESLRRAKYANVIAPLDGVEYIDGRAEFATAKTIEVGDRSLQPDRILIATGATPSVPPVEGLDEVEFLTSETAFELHDLPDSMVVIGGGYVGLECAQIFARFGTRVTVVEMQSQIVPTEVEDIAAEVKTHLQDEGIELRTSTRVTRVESTPTGVTVELKSSDGTDQLEVDELLVASGRVPNSDSFGRQRIDLATDDDGFVTVNSFLETTAEGIYAAGDVIGDPMFVYTAAYEGKVAARNALGGESTRIDYRPLPWVVFTDPQVAGVGLDERQAKREGFAPETAKLPLSEVPRSIAARDTRGFIKLIRDRDTDRLLGGRVVAPEGSESLMELGVAIQNEMTIEDLADMLHPYLTLSEGIRLAAMSFDTSIDELSCCAG